MYMYYTLNQYLHFKNSRIHTDDYRYKKILKVFLLYHFHHQCKQQMYKLALYKCTVLFKCKYFNLISLIQPINNLYLKKLFLPLSFHTIYIYIYIYHSHINSQYTVNYFKNRCNSIIANHFLFYS